MACRSPKHHPRFHSYTTIGDGTNPRNRPLRLPAPDATMANGGHRATVVSRDRQSKPPDRILVVSECLCRASIVSVMQSSDFGRDDDLAGRWTDRSAVRCILIQAEMGPVPMVIA